MSKQTYNFIPELKAKLTDYNNIDEQIKLLTEKKEFIRDQIENWMNLHNTQLFEVIDNKEQLWKISKSESVSNRVKDYDLLKSILPMEHKHLIVESTFEKFGLRKIDKHSKDWLLNNN